MSGVLDVDELDALIASVWYDVGEFDDVGDGDGCNAQYDMGDPGAPDEVLRIYLTFRVGVVDMLWVVLPDRRLLPTVIP